MGITNVGEKIGLNHDLFRVTKSVNRKKLQEYFRDSESAIKRQIELDELARKAPHLLDFLHNADLNPETTKNNNIGCRFVHVSLDETKRRSRKFTPCLSVQVGDKRLKKNKAFYISSSGWPEALHQAIDQALEYYLTLYPNGLSDDEQSKIVEWSRSEKTEDSVMRLLYKRAVECGIEKCIMATSYSVNGRMKYISFSHDKNNNPVLRVNKKGVPLKSKRIDDMSLLVSYAVYFTAILIHHTPFKDEVENGSFIVGIYFQMVTEWRTLVVDQNDGPPLEILTPAKFLEDVNGLRKGFARN